MIGMRDRSGRPFDELPVVFADEPAHHHRLPRLHVHDRLHGARVDRRRVAGIGDRPGIAHLRLHVERDEPARVDVRRYLQQYAGVDVLRCRRDDIGRRVGPAADEALLVDRNLVAGLDRGLLVVERGEVRIGDDLGVAVGVEQVQHRLHAAGEGRVVDDVGEALREIESRTGPSRGRRIPGLNGVPRVIRPPAPRPLGEAPLNSHSTPKSSSSVSVTDAIVTSIATCRDGTSSFFSAASITVYSGAVATMSSVLLSLSATTWMLRTMPIPSAHALDGLRYRPGVGVAGTGVAGVARCGLRLERRRRDDRVRPACPVRASAGRPRSRGLPAR